MTTTWRELLADVEASPEYHAYKRRLDTAERLTGWMRRLPLVGHLAATFWGSLLGEGIVSTCKPRWGALTFCYLNDGDAPTVYHTALSVLRPDTPIYPTGAPRWPRVRVRR